MRLFFSMTRTSVSQIPFPFSFSFFSFRIIIRSLGREDDRVDENMVGFGWLENCCFTSLLFSFLFFSFVGLGILEYLYILKPFHCPTFGSMTLILT